MDGLQAGLERRHVLTNLASVRSYGEFEFWFASIEVAAIVAFILLALGFAVGRVGDGGSFSHLTSDAAIVVVIGSMAFVGDVRDQLWWSLGSLCVVLLAAWLRTMKPWRRTRTTRRAKTA